MKKWAIPMLALMSVSALYGCGSQKQDITDVLDKLMNFKLENIEDYKSIGFGAIEESSKEAKGRIKGTPRKEEQTESDFGTAYYGGGPEPLYYESPSPFYLIGQLESGTIEKLKFQDNTDDLSIPISACLDCGDFLVFSPGENRNDSGPVYSSSPGRNGSGPGDNRNDSGPVCYSLCADHVYGNSFLLSKASGKIYDMRALGINFDRNNTFLTPNKVLMAGSYAIKEIEEGLETRDFSAINGMQVDKYGNILTATGDIFLLSDQQLRRSSSFTDENVTASYDELYKIIFAWNEQGETYVLDADNKFVKTKAAGFYDYLKSFNDQRVNINNIGTYWSAAISWAERNNYNDDLANSTEEERKDIISSWHKEMYGYSIFAFTEDGYVAVGCGATRPFAYYESGSKAYTPEGPIDKIYEYGYVRNDSATKDTAFSGGFGNSVIRGTAAYKLNDGEVYKYSFFDDSVTKLDVGIYRVTEMTISQDRRIEITGLYENLDTVKGYLDLNDQISFGEPNSKGITVLTPIN